MVANCDHLGLFFSGQLEHEILGKASLIPSNLFVEPFGAHAIEFSKIGIEDNFLPPQEQDCSFDPLYWNRYLLGSHGLLCVSPVSLEVVADSDRSNLRCQIGTSNVHPMAYGLDLLFSPNPRQCKARE